MLKFGVILKKPMDLNELHQKEIDSLRDENIELRNKVKKLEERIQELNSELGDKYRYHMMIGKSKKMQHIRCHSIIFSDRQ